MKTLTITELPDNLKSILTYIEKGEKIQIRRENTPIAYIVPCKSAPPVKNRTRLGCGAGTVKINADLTEPTDIKPKTGKS
jgi:antitoxin (DNA-binding transcriptional repressor) of toxin-antitoxin stability system